MKCKCVLLILLTFAVVFYHAWRLHNSFQILKFSSGPLHPLYICAIFYAFCYVFFKKMYTWCRSYLHQIEIPRSKKMQRANRFVFLGLFDSCIFYSCIFEKMCDGEQWDVLCWLLLYLHFIVLIPLKLNRRDENEL